MWVGWALSGPPPLPIPTVTLAQQLVLPFPPRIPTLRRLRVTTQKIRGLRRTGNRGAKPAAQPKCLPAPCLA